MLEPSVNSPHESPALTKPRVRGLIAGATILTLFGALWCIIALAFRAARPAWAIPAAVAATLALLGFCLLRLRASAQLPASHDPAGAAKGKRIGILFGIIFGIESGLIALTSALLARSDHGDWIPIAVALIVGLHFLPLARVFQAPLYSWTGVFTVLGALGCLFIRDVSLRLLCLGLVVAAVLWLTVVVLLVQTRPVQIR